MRCLVKDQDKEREAEMIALLIESRITARTRVSQMPVSAPAEVAAVLDRLALALGSTGGAGG